MRLILASGGIRTPERLRAWHEALRVSLDPGTTILFIPYALADHNGYERRIAAMLKPAGLRIHGVHHERSPVAAIRKADHILVGGGNTFRLLATMHRRRLLEPIRDRARRGAVYMGVSAGTVVACPRLSTTNDMPIVQPMSFDALGLVRFQINPHYVDGPAYFRGARRLVPYAGETRDLRLREFHEENSHPVVALREGTVLSIDGRKAMLTGPGGGRLFRRGKKPVELRENTDVSRYLGGLLR